MQAPKLVPAAPTLLRRAGCIVACWDGDELVLENYLSGRQVVVPPAVLQIVHAVHDYTARSALERELAAVPRIGRLVDELIAHDVLLVRGSPVERRDAAVGARWQWGQDARFFHFSTQRTRFDDLASEARRLAERAAAVPPPRHFKDYGVDDLALAEPRRRPVDFWDVLAARRTRRTFSPASLPFGDFSSVVGWTWGRTEERRDPLLGPYFLKTSPSGGARHPIEVYPLILRVQGVEPGFYHYCVARHSLARLRNGRHEALAVELCAGQPWVGGASAVFFMTAVLDRSMWKYFASHAYRVVQLDAGHLGQTFHLVCTALELAPFSTAAADLRGIERELGLDGVSEIAVYAAAVGSVSPAA